MPRLKLGDRMKSFEKMVNANQLTPLLPGIVRVDGRAFHSYTKGLKRPYDEGMSKLMIAVTKELMNETNALAGFTQSDEISLLLYSDNLDTQLYFDGRTQKIVSMTAAVATLSFNSMKEAFLPGYKSSIPLFDSRVFNVPTKGEAAAYCLWRERDATKNSITMAASAYYSHNFLHRKNSKQKQELLWQKNVNWNEYPNYFKRGTFVRRVKKETRFSTEELAKLPTQHEARKNPNLTITRSVLECMDMPPFDKVTNKVGVLFNGETPLTGV